jgi:hypothetical protein
MYLDKIIDDVTGHSLQSIDALREVHRLLDLKFSHPQKLKDALRARNQIVHEMDIVRPFPEIYDDHGEFRLSEIRRGRSLEELEELGRELLETAHGFIRKLDAKFEQLGESSDGDGL